MQKLEQRSMRAGLFALIVVTLSVCASVADIWDAFGQWGLLAGLILVLIVMIFGYYALAPVIKKNPRGVTLLAALEAVGLEDIESRNHDPHQLPPGQFYAQAKEEIVVTGISLLGTFKSQIENLQKAINAGVRVYALLLSPKSPDVQNILNKRELENMEEEIESALSIIRQAGLLEKKGFSIRLSDRLSPFTAVILDGDIEPVGALPRDKNGILRIQPARMFSEHHDGIILQFANNDMKGSGFALFAEDIRRQWAEAQPYR